MWFRRIRMHSTAFFALGAIALGVRCHAQAPAADEVRVHYNVDYTRTIDEQNRKDIDPQRTLDLYFPKPVKGAPATPILVFFHGGGWMAGDKSSEVEGTIAFARGCAKEGVAVVITNYRLAPKARHPAQIEDCAQAVAFIRRYAKEFNGDPGRLYVGGHSAGGHLAALLAVHPKYGAAVGLKEGEIKGVVSIGGVYSLTGLAGVVGFGFTAKRGDSVDASPIAHVSKTSPAHLMVIAEHELPGLKRQAYAMRTVLNDYGISADVVEVKDGNHVTEMQRAADPRHELHTRILAMLKGSAEVAITPPKNPEPPTTRRSRI